MEYEKSFIEVQFPVSKISKESYKERKANLGQILTGLGKWWGRKPLILVRASILGLLMPSSDNHKKDRDIFLKILSMDNEGLYQRKIKNMSAKEIFKVVNEDKRKKYFTENSTKENVNMLKIFSNEEKNKLQKIAFDKLSYDEKLNYCERAENVENVNIDSWKEINDYLNTDATNYQELIQQLGVKRYGRIPRIGDCFSGGGSIPFESVRLGADTYASDLNPIATLLTWADLNIATESDEEINKLREFQQEVYEKVKEQVSRWGIEENENGDKADSYLYCNEIVCPECGYKVPLAPSWIIGKGSKTVALLLDNNIDGFDIRIIQNASEELFLQADKNITIRMGKVYCPHCEKETPFSAIRRERKDNSGNVVEGLRKWESYDLISRDEDVFKERLYAIRYIKEYTDEKGRIKKERYFIEPNEYDIKREKKVLSLLNDNFEEFKNNGYIPTKIIENGEKTDEPIRTRGWKYWHQLFNPRQLLVNALFCKYSLELAKNKKSMAIAILGINKIADYNSKLCVWLNSSVDEHGKNTFLNQALNVPYNYANRGVVDLKGTWLFRINNKKININNKKIIITDARNIDYDNDIWITDPPYADAINYHELSEFFLAWDTKFLENAFPEWYTDSKRVLAVKGVGEVFNNSMIEVYSNLAKHMSDNGLQIVMFTHQDVKVWAELAMILWSSGLQVTAAWNIATETESGGLKDGNYVKGTVLLVLRKQTSEETAYLDELYPEIEEEVKTQIDSMRELDDKEDPNFSDPDYLLAAYAASLKVLTSYKAIEDIDVKYELSKNRNDKEETPIQKIINEAKKIAYDYLIPTEFDNYLWKDLKPVERFYLKGLEFEMNNMCKLSGYQELAKGFGVNEYNWMLGSTKANAARVKTPKEFAMRNINDNSVFGQSLLRNALASIYIALKEEDANKGLNWLKTEVNDYWNNRNMLVEILSYLSKVEVIDSMEHWRECSHEAYILKNLVENDSI